MQQDQISTGDGKIRTDTLYDPLGRPTQTNQYETSTQYINTTRAYDALGRIRTTTNPSRSGAGPATTYSYDALGRPLSVVTPDQSTSAVSYTPQLVNGVYTGLQAKVTDPAGKARRLTTNGLGWLVQVEEDPSGSDFVTTYGYDALDDVTSVTQGSQTRTYVFNARGWLTSSANPEQSSPVTWRYDNNGNPVYRRDPRGIQTCYQYDCLNRPVLQVYYTSSASGPCSGIRE